MAAAAFSCVEYWLEVALLPQFKIDSVSYIGMGVLGFQSGVGLRRARRRAGELGSKSYVHV